MCQLLFGCWRFGEIYLLGLYFKSKPNPKYNLNSNKIWDLDWNQMNFSHSKLFKIWLDSSESEIASPMWQYDVYGVILYASKLQQLIVDIIIVMDQFNHKSKETAVINCFTNLIRWYYNSYQKRRMILLVTVNDWDHWNGKNIQRKLNYSHHWCHILSEMVHHLLRCYSNSFFIPLQVTNMDYKLSSNLYITNANNKMKEKALLINKQN